MRDQHFLPVNTIIMVGKSHIFSNSRQQKPFDNVHLHQKIKKVFEEQRLLSTYNQTVEKFSKIGLYLINCLLKNYFMKIL